MASVIFAPSSLYGARQAPGATALIKNGLRSFTTPSVAVQRRREAPLGHHSCCFSYQVGFLLCITGWLHPLFCVSELNWSILFFFWKKIKNSYCGVLFFSFSPKEKDNCGFIFSRHFKTWVLEMGCRVGQQDQWPPIWRKWRSSAMEMGRLWVLFPLPPPGPICFLFLVSARSFSWWDCCDQNKILFWAGCMEVIYRILSPIWMCASKERNPFWYVSQTLLS
jgi:hypothetical protein